ncbi:type III pantothenate kinase [Sulfurimonas sp. SAG-AH-194-L11]|nr:type III pantothenate kinase [Sulfurimonas sp. SAG-AH-194-L11]
MLLCDIGNTSYHFLDESDEYKRSVGVFHPETIKEKVYYISVNSSVNSKLALLDNWIDLSSFVNRDSYYETMGIDRIVACEAVNNGIIIDAGSAITVDVVRESTFEGGFIYPGVNAMQKTYKDISPALDYAFNFSLNPNSLAKNSQDAISYGYLKLLYSEVLSHKLPIILTGGDADKLQALFINATINPHLLFNAMHKIIEKNL